MLRKCLAVFLVLVLGAVCAGCDLGTAAQRAEDPVYHNGYLGLTVSVPNGWILVDRNLSNMTELADDSARVDSLDKVSYGDGNYYIDLMEMQSTSNKRDEDYVRIHLFAEDYKLNLPVLADYVSASKKAYSGVLEDEGYYASFVSNRTAILGGKIFHKLLFLATSSEDKRSYYQEYYICELGELYFVAYGQYWVDNDNARQMIYDTLKSIRFDDEEDTYNLGEASRKRSFYNDFLELKVDVPAGYVAIYNDDNVSEQRGEIVDLSQMQRQDYSDGGYYYDLIKIQNSEKANSSTFAQLDLFVEEYESFLTFDQYIEAAEIAYRSFNGSTSAMEMKGRETKQLNGVEYEVLTFYSSYGGYYYGTGPFFAKYYIRKIGDLYFVACLSYMEDSDKSIDDAEELLENTFSFWEKDGESI